MWRCVDEPSAVRGARSFVPGHALWATGPAPAGRARLTSALASLALTALVLAHPVAAHAAALADTATLPTGSIIERGAVAPRVPGEVPSLDEREALRLGESVIGKRVPDVTLRDRQGRAVRLSDYRGKPLLVSFIYTGCFQVCPTQTRALHEAVKGLDRMLGEHQFNVVSIGFNQPFDSPDAMRSFAAQNRIGYRNWEFLSPARELVDPLTQAFGFSFVATPAGFDHVLGVTVVDAHGRIHAQVYGDRLRADQLGKPLRELLLQTPPQAASTLASVVERVRILCTVYDPDTGEYRYDYKLIFELIGGALFFFSVTLYLLFEWRDQRRARRASCTANPRASGSAA
jgi:protein SCO1/2